MARNRPSLGLHKMLRGYHELEVELFYDENYGTKFIPIQCDQAQNVRV